MMKKKKDGNATAEQRLMWDDLRKNINSLVNTVNESNIKKVAEELVSKNNLIWGRGLFCRSILKSSVSFPVLVPVFASLVAFVNSKFPDIGYLLLKRILFQAKIAYKLNDKIQLLTLGKLLAHLVNQFVAHEIVALEFLFVLLQDPIPTKECLEISVSVVKECGFTLYQGKSKGLCSIFKRFQEIGNLDYPSKCLIKCLLDIRKSGFLNFPSILPEFDIVELDDQVTHEISYSNDIDPEMSLDIFHPNSNLLTDDEQYNFLHTILQVEEEEHEIDSEETSTSDRTEFDVINLRKNIVPNHNV
ncbi:hypothetical protein M9H77_34959 [Catharanthus roseus]|uniref:Uncharacterized protein n=1 Tax=Catharanthus roseus TaxID=4058 RepID=A0ACB9ZNJ6_CATRO|nr:hypothetical protein M9H77_34959 [Catharanthus roseus]